MDEAGATSGGGGLSGVGLGGRVGEVEVLAEEVGGSASVRLEVLGHLGLPARVDLEVLHGCGGRAGVVGLVVADDEAGVRVEEEGVVAPPGVAQGLAHLVPDALVYVGVFGEFLGADAQEEAGSVGAGLARGGEGVGQRWGLAHR